MELEQACVMAVSFCSCPQSTCSHLAEALGSGREGVEWALVTEVPPWHLLSFAQCGWQRGRPRHGRVVAVALPLRCPRGANVSQLGAATGEPTSVLRLNYVAWTSCPGISRTLNVLLDLGYGHPFPTAWVLNPAHREPEGHAVPCRPQAGHVGTSCDTEPT